MQLLTREIKLLLSKFHYTVKTNVFFVVFLSKNDRQIVRANEIYM